MPETSTAPASAPGRTPDHAIEARGLTKAFGAFTALDAVSLTIGRNEFFTLLGPSGCGKTTLLRLIAGFEQPTAGTLALDGRDVTGDPPYRRPVNTVFQSYALFPHLTVARNIAFGLEMLERPRDEIRATVAEMLRLVRMEHLAERRTAAISGGQQQRVALARALAPRPRVLLLDEPLSALDLKLRKEMQLELKRLQSETGVTFVFVTHDQEEALTMSDRVAVMSEGRILQIGTPREIYDHPAERFVADFIGETNFLNAEILSREGRRVRLRLACGPEAEAELPEGFEPKGAVTVALRPEHVALAAPDDPAAAGAEVRDLIYVGADTQLRLALDNGETATPACRRCATPRPRRRRETASASPSRARRCRCCGIEPDGRKRKGSGGSGVAQRPAERACA